MNENDYYFILTEDIMTENYQDDTLRIFSLNANRPLAEKIAASVGTELGKHRAPI